MKKISWMALLILCLLFLVSCLGPNNSAPSEAEGTSQLQTNIAFYQALPDDELVLRIAEIDLHLIGDNELLFSDPETIPTKTLFIFFLSAFNQEVYYGDREYKEFFDESSDLFFIPVKDIKETLQRYFEKFSFDPKEISDYDPATDTIRASTMSGYGSRSTKLESKSFDQDRLTMTVIRYADLEHQEIMYRKTYTVRFTADGFFYLSIARTDA
jgi:hypothetical protein